MKLTKQKLKQIIKEEITKVLKENLDLADVIDTIEYAVEDASKKRLDAKAIKLRLRQLQQDKDFFRSLATVPDELLMTAINTLLRIGPREYEYDPHADI